MYRHSLTHSNLQNSSEDGWKTRNNILRVNEKENRPFSYRWISRHLRNVQFNFFRKRTFESWIRDRDEYFTAKTGNRMDETNARGCKRTKTRDDKSGWKCRSLIGFRNYQLTWNYTGQRSLSADLTKISIISFVVILTLQILARNYRASA